MELHFDHQLVATESGFYLQVTWEGSPYLVSQIEHMAMSAHTTVAPTPDDFHGWVHPQSGNYGVHTWRQSAYLQQEDHSRWAQ